MPLNQVKDEIEYEPSSNVNNENETNKNTLKTTENITLKPNQLIKFTDDENVEYEATVINRDRKASGKYNSCYNIRYHNPTEFTRKISWIDLRNVNDLIVILETESSNNTDLSENLLEENNISNNTENKQHTTQNTEEVYSNHHLYFQKAKEKELKSWKDNNVYEVAPYSNQKCISVKWVCSVKETINVPQEKAQLVARGFEEDTLNNFEKQSPTTSKDSLHVILSTIASKKWPLKAIDIKTAFLQCEKLTRKSISLHLQKHTFHNHMFGFLKNVFTV